MVEDNRIGLGIGMGKWFIITCGVLAGFFVIVLGLGYLLKTNEDAHQEYITNQVAQTSQQAEPIDSTSDDQAAPEAVLIFVDNTPASTAQQDILLNNLTCVTHSQCKVQQVPFSRGICTVAINTVGAALLKRYQGEKSDIGDCAVPMSAQLAQCIDNVCTLTKS